jgi:hypothetical protein
MEVVVLVAVGAADVVELLPFRLLRREFGLAAAGEAGSKQNAGGDSDIKNAKPSELSRLLQDPDAAPF